MEFSGLIFKELIKRGYSLEGKTRVWNIADSKLWYLTPEQAQAYLDLDSSNEYKKAVNQEQGRALIRKNAQHVLDKVGKDGVINVVDLGCGDGKRAADLIKAFDGKIKVRYCPVDISGYMVQKAIETFSKENLGEIVEFKYNISDFENLENITPLLTKTKFKRNLFLLLGNTLGNFEIHELLYSIRNAMNADDLLLVDTALVDPNIREKTEMQSKNQKVDYFLSFIPLQLGLRKGDIEYGARFKNSRIEYYYTVKQDRRVELHEKALQFYKGDRIIVAIAYKHDLEDLTGYFNLYFEDIEAILSDDRSQVFVFCKKAFS